MNINILRNVKTSIGGTTHRFRAGVHDVPQAVGEALVKSGLAEAAKTVKADAPKAQPKQEAKKPAADKADK